MSVALVPLLCIVWPLLASASVTNYTAIMNGSSMVPPVDTSASGMTYLLITTHGTKADTLSYRVYSDNLVEPRSVELHEAAAGQTNPRVAYLFGPQNDTSPQPISGILASGTLKSSNISGTHQEKVHTVKEIKKKADDGQLYVQVNTTAHPDGEIRGQFQKNS